MFNGACQPNCSSLDEKCADRANTIEWATRDVHSVMSTALPFVNYVSHAILIHIRRNLNSYSITMKEIVLTCWAMWLLDVIKKRDVNCAWKTSIPKLSQHHKAEVTVTFLKERNIQVLQAHPSLQFPVWILATSGNSTSKKKSLVGKGFPALTPGPRKSRKFRSPCIVCIRLSKCLLILAQVKGFSL